VKSVETHARAFLTLNILTIGTVIPDDDENLEGPEIHIKAQKVLPQHNTTDQLMQKVPSES
jgi:hypothetical protein